jgi:hypothetical protein
MGLYDVLKDFAGPVVTLIAAGAATSITYVINRNQVRIAQSQRDIALDRLKFDLHTKRYEIYEAAKTLLEHVALVNDIKKSDPSKVRTLYIKLDEARFYFPPEIQASLAQIHDGCERFLRHLGERENVDIDNEALWRSSAEILAADMSHIRMLYEKLPATFEKSLAFTQLTTTPLLQKRF